MASLLNGSAVTMEPTVSLSTITTATTVNSPTVGDIKMNDTVADDKAYTPASTDSTSTPISQEDLLVKSDPEEGPIPSSNLLITTAPNTKTSNPCSNDNPDWEEGTQPCPNSTTEYIFDGTDIITIAATASSGTNEEETIATNQVKKELASSYSCEQQSVTTSNVSEATEDDTTNNNKGAIYFRFNYEIYTAPNRTTTKLQEILSEFELQLGYGVASAVGLIDCSAKNVVDGLEIMNANSVDGKKRLRHGRYERRSLQKNLEGYEFMEISVEPLDIIDTTLLQCTSEARLSSPNQCTPIHGFMTAHLVSQRRRHLSKQYGESPEQYLLSTVESYMTNNQSLYLTNELLHVSYVGERDLQLNNIDPGVLARPVANNVEVEQAYPGSRYVGIGVAVVFIGVLWAGLIYSHREDRRGGVEEEDEMDMEEEEDDDVNAEESENELEEGDGAFPVLKNVNSTAASNGGLIQQSQAKLLLNESNVSDASSVPTSLDPNVPTDNLFGLQGKVSSDEYVLPPPKEDTDDNSDDIDVFEPNSPTESDSPPKDDESVKSQQIESISSTEEAQDDNSTTASSNAAGGDIASQESSRDESPANDPNWAGVVNKDTEATSMNVNLSPSEATEKMSNTAPFILENNSSDVEDGLESEDDEVEGVPSLI